MFTPSEACQSSTFRELKAFYLLVKANIQFFCHKKVKVFTDNENAFRIVLFGSPKQPPQSVAIDLFQLCLTNDIQIETQWIPRYANQKADIISRFCRQRRLVAEFRSIPSVR